MVKKTYKELLEGLKYSDLGYTGERKPLTDPKYKQFTDTINKNTVIANTHIDSSLPTQMPQAQVSGPMNKNRRNAGMQDPKSAEEPTVGNETTVGGAVPTETPLTIDAKYSDFTKWAQEHGVDSDKVFQDAMALARTQYEQSRATYGLQAEQLAQAGLTNSGVSDNLERAAYAQKVQAEQAALDQKAALDLANKQAYGQYKDQQKQQYTDLFQKYVFGYEDEFGNIHAPVSPDEAEALLKLAGLNDEAMIADLRKSYDEYKGIGDKKMQEQQQAIAGIDSTTGGFSADSMFGKLFETGDSATFLNDVATKYDIQATTDEEAVDALYDNKLITREQRSMFYRQEFINGINAVAQSGEKIKTILKNGESDLYTAIKSASEAYQQGILTKDDWTAFKEQVFSGSASFSVSATVGQVDIANGNIVFEFEMGLGDTSTEFSATAQKVDENTSTKLDALANGASFVTMNGKLYIKPKKAISTLFNNSLEKWYEVPSFGNGTKRTNAYAIVELLSQP